ncbi:phosphoglycerate dehydrogenase [Caldibacillus lycopersici]|uniref:Phosphoglycerate dehydrogenase n=1 Tax=Perspicuibacillus lycopersici TaxID=1325689 RepID=A0AAE3LPI6_9BACI|nr:phosphoglycerate dehydrogenase [Perspicuibacillus lycopersici]MCU9612384.1 phosphoglycerate dehydrogenase [Perspicuibacillus lycopersici]
MKILFMIRDAFYEANPKLIEDAKRLGEVKVLFTDNGIDNRTLLEEVAEVDIIVVAVVKITKEVIDAATNLKYIIKYGAGYDNIDVAYANVKGIVVTNSPGQNAESVADHAFGLMLASARNIAQKDKELKEHHWELTLGYEIHRKRLGIIGFGSIGKAIAKRALGFEMDTVAFGNYKDFETAEKLHVQFVEKEELFSTSDFIIIATSINEKNRGMINKHTLGMMKSTAFIINVSRGGLINEEDLIDFLKYRKIKGAALDVFATEPPLNELATLDNVVATPHIGGSTNESIRRIGEVTLRNIQRFLEGEQLDYIVKSK